MPKVSVLIPCYNGGSFLKPAIESVFAQTLEDWELIIIDNCSEDDSYALSKQYSERDARIKAFRNETNLGMVGNWNRGCELAAGDYVKILCADDTLRPDCLAIQADLLDRYPSAVICSGSSVVINASDKPLLKRHPISNFGPRKELLINAQDLVKTAIHAAANIIGEPTLTMFRASTMREVGNFDDSFRYGTDLEYWLRLLVEGKGDIILTRNLLAEYRVHPAGLTNQQMVRGQEELARMFKKYTQVWDDIPFNEPEFRQKYQKQSAAKKQVLRFANSFWAAPILRMLDQLRWALNQ